MLENDAFHPVSAKDFPVWAVRIGAGTVFALISGNANPGQF